VGRPVTDVRTLLAKARAETEALYAEEVRVDLGSITLFGVLVTDGAEFEERVAIARKKYPRRWQTHVQRTVVCAQTRRIEIGGQAVEDEDGRPLVFTDPGLWELQNADPQVTRHVSSAVDSLLVMLVSDMAISRAAKEFGADIFEDDEGSDPI